MGMLVFSDIFRWDSRSVLLLSHFRWIITQLEKQWIKLMICFGDSSYRSTSQVFGHSC